MLKALQNYSLLRLKKKEESKIFLTLDKTISETGVCFEGKFKGQTIVFPYYALDKILIDNETVYSIKNSDVIAIIEENNASNN